MRIARLFTRTRPAAPGQTLPRYAICLDDIKVASPCPANWSEMIGDDRVRHCGECNLNVYNLSKLTRAEAEQSIAMREGRLCVRFYRRADGTVLTQDCPRGWEAAVRRASRVAGAALSAIMSLGTAFAQAVPVSCSQDKKDETTNRLQVLFVVTDPQGAAISGARIFLFDRHGKKQFSGATDRAGAIEVRGIPLGRYEVRVESRSFKTYKKRIALKDGNPMFLNIQLRLGGDVVVIGVVAEPTLLERDSATVQTTFDGELLNHPPH